MAYTVKISDRLLPKCAYIRKAVFMEEQGFQQEFDEIDDRAYHALILDGETPAAVGRLYTEDGKTYIIGRIAVMPSYRGKHLGERVVTALEEQAKACGAASIALSAQCRVAGFYEKLGYTQTDDFHSATATTCEVRDERGFAARSRRFDTFPGTGRTE